MDWFCLAITFGIAMVGIVIGAALGGIFLTWLESRYMRAKTAKGHGWE